MSKKVKKQPRNKAKSNKKPEDPWISMRTGIIVISLISIGMAVLTAWSIIPALGWREGLLWGLGSGAAIWGVFMIALLFNWYVRGKRGAIDRGN